MLYQGVTLPHLSEERETKAMCTLRSSDMIDMNVAATLEEFVCCLYGLNNISQFSDGRLPLQKTVFPWDTGWPARKDKVIRSMLLSSCRAVLEEKLNHVTFIGKMREELRQGNLVQLGRQQVGNSLAWRASNAWESATRRSGIRWDAYTGRGRE